MDKHTIAGMRLAAQHISKADFETPEAVVRHMLAMQAQDYYGALWSVGLRTRGAIKLDVEQAIADRKIVRTWPMRGTLHLLHADDVHWMVRLLAPRATKAAEGRRIKQLGLTDEIVDQAERALRAALQGGKSIMRNQVVGLLAAKVQGLTITNQHTQHLMRNFGERGVICFGPYAGKQPTFVLLDEWVKPPNPRPREKTLAELAERYFISHGPATLKDFAGWGMLTMQDAKIGLRHAEAQLEQAWYGDKPYYYAKGLRATKPSGLSLLPGFDEYLLGYKDRGAVLQPAYSERIVPGGNGMFKATILKDGQVIGTWSRAKRKALHIESTFFSTTEALPDPLVNRYAEFLGSD